ncbi:MAG: ABC transporter permease subunit [Treponema sp.]|jgi:putative aldouronate transport system permease protein|nr:ABC transporter permease subunit [Treponema sp.]
MKLERFVFNTSLRNFWKYRHLYLLFLPIAAYFLVFCYYPFFKGIIMSFQANQLLGARPFVGLDNYRAVLRDPDFLQSIFNSLLIGIADMVLYFILSLALALFINELFNKTLRKTIHTIAFLPHLFSWAVIGGIWLLVFDRQGTINQLLGFFDRDVIHFMAEQDYARPLIIGMGVWKSIGYFALLFSVSITSIDPTLFEVARIDGAGRFTQIFKIIIPSLKGTMKVILVLLSTGILTHFDEIYVMQNPINKRFIRTLLLYVFETGILNFKLGIATAGAALVMAGTLAMVGISRRLTKYDE